MCVNQKVFFFFIFSNFSFCASRSWNRSVDWSVGRTVVRFSSEATTYSTYTIFHENIYLYSKRVRSSLYTLIQIYIYFHKNILFFFKYVYMMWCDRDLSFACQRFFSVFVAVVFVMHETTKSDMRLFANRFKTKETQYEMHVFWNITI